jgi:hypothetical protein
MRKKIARTARLNARHFSAPETPARAPLIESNARAAVRAPLLRGAVLSHEAEVAKLRHFDRGRGPE